jgi:uncharacterized protein (DUF58 family)
MRAAITEQIPAALAVQDGITSVTAEASGSPQTFRLNYRITPLVHGEMKFAGLKVSGTGLLFEDQIDLASAHFCGPSLFIQPAGMFEPASRRTMTETREIEKMSVLSGLGIRALREYFSGDDLRRIDWKLSAKHDKLFVKEYAGILSLPPLIIVDLPWRGSPGSSEEFSRLVSAVAGMVEYCSRTYQYVSVLVISGPNILNVIEDEKDLQRCMSALREWMHPAERTVSFYRMADRADLRSRIRDAGIARDATADAATIRFQDTLKKYYSMSLQSQQSTAFAGQIARALSSATADEIFLFSLFSGDISHLRQVVRQAKTEKLHVHVRVPKSAGRETARAEYQQQLGADSLEVFA